MSFQEYPNLSNFFPSSLVHIDVDRIVSEAVNADVLSLERELDSGWPWPLDAVQRFFEDFWGFIANIPAKVWQFFNDALRGAIEWLWNNIAWPIARFTWEVYQITHEWTAGWPEPWGTIARFFLFPPAFLYKSFRDYIGPALGNAIKEIERYFNGAVGAIFDAIRNAFSPIFEPLASFASAVVDFFTKTMPDFIRSAIDFFASLPKRVADFFSWLSGEFYNAFTGLVDFFTKTLPDHFRKFIDFLAGIPEALRKLFLEDLPRAFLTGLSIAWEWIDKNIVAPARDALAKIWEAISGAISSMLRGAIEFFSTLPEDFRRGGAEAVIAKLLPVAAAGFGIALAVDVASIKVMGTGVDLDAVKNFVNNVVLKWFDVSVFTSVFLAIAVQKPLEYVVQRAFRTARPSPGDALKFLSKNIIDREEALEYLRIAGYPDAIAEEYLASIYREPDFSSVFTAYKRGKISEEEYRTWLSILNIDEARIKGGVLYPYRVFEEAQYKVPSPFVLVSAIETGELSEDFIKRVLEFELVHPELVDVVTRALTWRSLKDERSLLRRYVIDLFGEGVLSATEFEGYLGLLGVTGDYARIITEVASLNREKNVRKKVFSQLEKMFLEGYSSRTDFVEKATSLGYDRDLVEKYASLLEYVRDNYYVLKETRDERNSYRSVLVKRFKEGYLSEEELRSELLKLNLNDIEVELTVARAKLEYDAEQKSILLNDLIEKLKAGKLSKSEFVDECAKLGIKYERCLAYANYYWSKYIGDEFYKLTQDERNALASALIKKFVNGFMTEEELKQELSRLGFTAEEIELRVRRAIAEDEMKMLSDLLSEADSLLKRGEISEAEYVSYLVSLGMREERARARARKILATVRKPMK